MFRITRGVLRVAREGLRRAWNLRLAATISTVFMQLWGLFLIALAGWMVYHPLGLFVGGVLLVWLGNGLQPESETEDDINGPGGA